MPLYDYQCGKCNHEFELFCKISDREVAEKSACPSCGEVGCINQKIGAPLVGDPFRHGAAKVPEAFQRRLQQIHDSTAGSKLNENSTLTRVE